MTCQWCGATFTRTPGVGRRPRFCCGACRVASHRAGGLPRVMATGHRWVRADGKRPIQTSGRAASSTDPATWATLGEVRASRVGDGLGVMLGGGLGCYDLDDVTPDQVSGFLRTIPERVVYIERSMSGRGVHVFIEATEGPGWRRVVGGLRVERYTRARFIRTTLDLVP